MGQPGEIGKVGSALMYADNRFGRKIEKKKSHMWDRYPDGM